MDIAIGKAKAAATYRRPTRAFMDVINKGGPATATLPGVFASPGGVPIMVDGKVIGAVGVSGVPATRTSSAPRPAQEHEARYDQATQSGRKALFYANRLRSYSSCSPARRRRPRGQDRADRLVHQAAVVALADSCR